MSAGSITALVETLVAAGCTPDMILAAVRTAEATKDDALEKSREKTRNRVKKWRAARVVTLPGVTERSVPTHVSASPAPDLENKQTNKEERKQDSAPVARGGLKEFADELSSILNTERVDAIIAVRRKKGAVLSAHAGRLLVKALMACPDVRAAADEMVLRNWTGIKPDWLESRSSQRSHAPPHQGDGYNAVLNRIINGKSDEHAGPTIDASYDRADSGGPTNLVQLNAFPKGH